MIAADVTQAGRDHWTEVVPEQKDVLQSVTMVGGRLIALYLKDAQSQVRAV